MEKQKFDLAKYPLQQETDLILRIAIDIHKRSELVFWR